MSALWWTEPAALSVALGRLGVVPTAAARVHLDTLPSLGLLAGAASPSPAAPLLLGSPRWAGALPAAPKPASPPPGPMIEPFRPPAGALGERLDAYLDWLSAAVRGRRAFIADRDGLPLAGEASEHDLMAIGSAITRLVQRINDRAAQRVGAGVLLEVAGERLQLMLVESDLGVFTVGLVVAEPLAPETLRRLEDGLQRALADDDR